MFKESICNDGDCDLINCRSGSMSEEILKNIFTKKNNVETCKFVQNTENDINLQSTNTFDTKKTNPYQSNSNYSNSSEKMHTNKYKNTAFNKKSSFNKNDENYNSSNTNSVEECKPRFNSFKTAREEYQLQNIKNGKTNDSHQQPQSQKRSLGMTGSGKRKYTPPAMVNR